MNKNLKILIVDDFATARKILLDQLMELDFTGSNIVSTRDGEEALAILQKDNSFDLIITDWVMPKMNGLELLKAIRSDPNIARIPVIMLTAEGQKEQILEAIRAKVSNYIVKPLTVKALADKIAMTFSKQKKILSLLIFQWYPYILTKILY